MKILDLLSAVCRDAFLLNHNYTLKTNSTGLITEPSFIMSKKRALTHISKRDFKKNRRGICIYHKRTQASLSQTKGEANHSGKAFVAKTT